MLDMISIFLNVLRFDLWPKMWSILENVPCALEKRCILLHLDGMSWRYQWDPSRLMYYLRLVFPYFLFWWSVHWCEWGVKSLQLLLCYCQFLLLYLLMFVLCIEVLLCWVHIYLQLLCLLGLVPWWLCNKCPSLSLVIFSILRSFCLLWGLLLQLSFASHLHGM